jgi:hypothetical protein
MRYRDSLPSPQGRRLIGRDLSCGVMVLSGLDTSSQTEWGISGLTAQS